MVSVTRDWKKKISQHVFTLFLSITLGLRLTIMTESQKVIKNKFKRPPARIQLDPSTVTANGKPEQTGQVFNIWYSKWTGGENNGRIQLTHSKTRCHIKQDSGYTRADKNLRDGTVNRTKHICLYFARGACCNGKSCEYLHRLPTDLDFFSPSVDCFGREKFLDYRDDMSGIGSFGRVNRTLYIGRINNMEGNIEQMLSKNFGEFGDIERMRVIKDKNVAFITYKLENQAQFAKEAMYGQSLIQSNENEALNIRWANEDPDPNARKRDRIEMERTSLETAKKILNQIQNEQIRMGEKEVTIEEPASTDQEDDNEIKMINSKDFQLPAKPIINLESLYTLRQLQAKKQKLIISGRKSTPKPVNALSSVCGYSSSEEE